MVRLHTDRVFNNCGVCDAFPAIETEPGRVRVRCSECENTGNWETDPVELMVNWNKVNRKIYGTEAVCENPLPGI